MNLFQLGEFKLHSGDRSKWKIDCDALSDDDIYTLAFMIREIIPDYNTVHGIPNGGIRLEEALNKLISPQPTFSDLPRVLIVDDVLTTGKSMQTRYDIFNCVSGYGYIKGAVIFARTKNYPNWITPLFQMPEKVNE